MAYTPTVFTKAGYPDQIAYTAADAIGLRWDGWLPIGTAPVGEPTIAERVATLEDGAEAQALLVDGFADSLSAIDASKASTTSVTSAIAAAESRVNNRYQRPRYDPLPMLRGPVTTETVTVTLGSAADGAFNESYAISGSTVPAIWPVDAWGKMTASGGIWSAKTASPTVATVSTYRMMTDGDAIAIFTYAALGFQMSVYVDGRPLSGNPYTPAVTTGFAPLGLQKIDFGSAKPEGRLIEIRMIGGLAAVYVKKPYRVWKPPASRNPKIAVVGDSYVTPTVMQDAASGMVTVGGYDAGIYQQMHEHLGITSLVTDGVGGSGYIAGGGSNRPYGHAERLQWLIDIQPDVIVVHGGGANDLFNSNSVSACISAVTAYFTTLRSNHPNAKLVFMEGFAPPSFTPATYNPNYIAIRQGAQSALNAAGVEVYFIDVATTRPPLDGTGYVTAPVGNTNSNIYVGSDAVHLSAKGNRFARAILAPKIARVLHDDGRLAGTLIL